MKIRTNLLRDIKKYYVRELSLVYNTSEAETMLNLLIEHFFNLSRTDLSLQPDCRLSETEILKLHFAVKELKTEKPIQYIIGESEFGNIKLKVSPAVLIPRPETEELVKRIVDENSAITKLIILDIGTGSGAIALSLKKELPDSTVSAIEVSKEALEVAVENRNSTGLDVEFYLLNILNKNDCAKLGSYDLIVSNPPYVTEVDRNLMKKNVTDFEPHIALFVTDEDPLLFYDAIIGFALNHLNAGGSLWFEINENMGDRVRNLLSEKGFINVKLYHDFHGKDRFVVGYLN